MLTQSAFLRPSLNPQVVKLTASASMVRGLLRALVAHPGNRYLDTAPSVLDPAFDDLEARIAGHRQVTDATLLWLAKIHGVGLVTFDRALVTWTPWPAQVSLLVP